ncbi:transcriptional regulator, TetR family [Streptoalloteichus tenebrarius]|uniref:Transcriptional regulator, TetR family n=1 Tax=Streptoalloteichus tenebrarius (strain ATCC 17920 / DSM 40477 / JCM 4838 / CBS 697.72 / NBRC 16177 / NCIMB 11028 / NRRL B-12390 / A12253. 1 / ISP 5477) TaxID=1933 RepID=A0ABT1HTJ4_STRSD|nr:TetR/AcrR family transcriptional regulator [Streptoalloteichus tenebrarius]MCP2258834.1 transcriptional regulator, TetR family [Streptoalloteichus tenebrarius]BFE99481.1 TetR/AcrR family transcriptional regulator [Streptoalloteichus tenebrarius]
MRTEKGPDPTRRSERSRQAILTAALDLVVEIGYRKMTIEAIAARAGVGKQTIYRWWPSKGAVVFDAILALSQGDTGDTRDARDTRGNAERSAEAGAEGVSEGISEGISEGAAFPDTGDLEADLKLVFRATIEELRDPRFDLPYRSIITEIQHDPALTEELHQRLVRPMLEMIKERLRSAQQAGQLAEDADLDLAVELIYGALYYRWLLRTGPLTPEFGEQVVEWALKGLGAGRTP